MADCPIATRVRLLALLTRQLPADEQQQLRAHLQTPCERCLELFDQLAEGELAEAMGGAKVKLTPRERAGLFRSVLPDNLQPTTFWDGLRELGRVPSLLMTYAAVTALLIGFGVYYLAATPEARSRYTGGNQATAPTGSPALQASLIGVIGRVVDGQPDVIRRAVDNELLASDELLLFRYRLNEPAYIYLLTDSVDGVEVLYSGDTELASPGEYELGAADQALALDPRPLGEDVRIVLVASSERQPQLGQLESLEVVLDPARRVDSCLSCAVDEIRVRTSQQP